VDLVLAGQRSPLKAVAETRRRISAQFSNVGCTPCCSLPVPSGGRPGGLHRWQRAVIQTKGVAHFGRPSAPPPALHFSSAVHAGIIEQSRQSDVRDDNVRIASSKSERKHSPFGLFSSGFRRIYRLL